MLENIIDPFWWDGGGWWSDGMSGMEFGNELGKHFFKEVVFVLVVGVEGGAADIGSLADLADGDFVVVGFSHQ